jgi:hypothetical protein
VIGDIYRAFYNSSKTRKSVFWGGTCFNAGSRLVRQRGPLNIPCVVVGIGLPHVLYTVVGPDWGVGHDAISRFAFIACLKIKSVGLDCREWRELVPIFYSNADATQIIIHVKESIIALIKTCLFLSNWNPMVYV